MRVFTRFCGLTWIALSHSLAALLWQSPSMAQTKPSAGSLFQQIEREQHLPQLPELPRAPQWAGAAPLVPTQPSGGPTVVVQAFSFTGNTVFSGEQLGAVLTPLRGRALDFAQLQQAAGAVADFYRREGWLVQAFLPEQDVVDGVVNIAVREAVFGRTQVLDRASAHSALPRIERIISHAQATGGLVHLRAIERALLLADDLPGVVVSGDLSPGAAGGQTDLVLRLADEPTVSGSIAVDNTASVSTGAEQWIAALHLHSPTGQGDEARLDASKSEGSRYLRLAYSVPLGDDGVRIAFNASGLDYALVAGGFQDGNFNGSSTSTGLELSYPWVRSHSRNLWASLGADWKRFLNRAAGSIQTDYANAPWTLGLNGDLLDVLGGGARTAFSLAVSAGRVSPSGDAAVPQAGATYTKLRYALSREQQIAPQISAYGAWSGQWSADALDASENFYLGGANGVRAYPSGEGGGPVGQLLSLELRWQMPNGLQCTGFYDYGLVAPKNQDGVSDAAVAGAYALKGAGLALAWRPSPGLALQATYAHRDGENPNALQGLRDQDGTLVRDRLWLSAAFTF